MLDSCFRGEQMYHLIVSIGGLASLISLAVSSLLCLAAGFSSPFELCFLFPGVPGARLYRHERAVGLVRRALTV